MEPFLWAWRAANDVNGIDLGSVLVGVSLDGVAESVSVAPTKSSLVCKEDSRMHGKDSLERDEEDEQEGLAFLFPSLL